MRLKAIIAAREGGATAGVCGHPRCQSVLQTWGGQRSSEGPGPEVRVLRTAWVEGVGLQGLFPLADAHPTACLLPARLAGLRGWNQ